VDVTILSRILQVGCIEVSEGYNFTTGLGAIKFESRLATTTTIVGHHDIDTVDVVHVDFSFALWVHDLHHYGATCRHSELMNDRA
jgi:hypothetical protein